MHVVLSFKLVWKFYTLTKSYLTSICAYYIFYCLLTYIYFIIRMWMLRHNTALFDVFHCQFVCTPHLLYVWSTFEDHIWSHLLSNLAFTTILTAFVSKHTELLKSNRWYLVHANQPNLKMNLMPVQVQQ